MLVLSNALANRADEGCVKVANSLIKRLKDRKPDMYIVTYDRDSQIADAHLKLNKFLLNFRLSKIIRNRKEKVLYFPFPAKPIATALRIFVLSRFSHWGLEVVLTQQAKMDAASRFLLKLSRAKLIVFSKDSFDYYGGFLKEGRVSYLKTGVDTGKFTPVSQEQKQQLRRKYGVDPDRPVILHVGHLKYGRNIAQLMKFYADYQVILIVSTLTRDEQDEDLRKLLEERDNIRIIDDYQENIQEFYQLSDIYFFPVVTCGYCIDVPLSCLEAAACNKPVLTTRYGEMATFEGKSGFWFMDRFDKDYLNQMTALVLEEKGIMSREHVLGYDWDHAISYFEGM